MCFVYLVGHFNHLYLVIVRLVAIHGVRRVVSVVSKIAVIEVLKGSAAGDVIVFIECGARSQIIVFGFIFLYLAGIHRCPVSQQLQLCDAERLSETISNGYVLLGSFFEKGSVCIWNECGYGCRLRGSMCIFEFGVIVAQLRISRMRAAQAYTCDFVYVFHLYVTFNACDRAEMLEKQ